MGVSSPKSMGLLLLLLTGEALGASPPHVKAWIDATDFAVEEVEASLVLAEYLRVDTINPPGNESAGAQFLAEQLAADGIESTLTAFSPGRDSLIAKLEGRPAQGQEKEGALCLLSHIDVVEAETDAWIHPPLSGKIDGGFIWGRGAIDMKGTGALQLQVFRMLHQMNIPLKRDVVLLAVADEESGNQGIQHVLDNHWQDIQCSQAFNEGGIGIKDLLFEGQDVFSISIGEKGVLWLRMTANGTPGHGSTPRPDQSPDILLQALNRLKDFDEPFAPPPVFDTLMSLIGIHQGGVQGWILQRPFLIRTVLKRKILSKHLTRAATTNTINVTGLSGAIVPNVVPSQSSALLDIRVLPGRTTSEMQQKIVATIDDPRISFEVLTAREAEMSPADDPAYWALAHQIARLRPESVVGPIVSPGFTDSVFLRQHGVNAYGLAPFLMSDKELIGMHGHNERISVENMRLGLQILWGAVLELAAEPDARPPLP
jgi:acetylornithine deacetylase/succinyl-diaminopimelate desuccinylase-like protein